MIVLKNNNEKQRGTYKEKKTIDRNRCIFKKKPNHRTIELSVK
jgi:hypothetical protein